MGMRRLLLVVTIAVVVSVAGCAGFGGEPADNSPGDSGTIESADPATNATDAAQTVRVEANESIVGSEWESLSVTYPREEFTVDSVQHRDIEIGVDTNDDGRIDRRFNETHVSGVNNNDYSFTVELDTGYTIETGDVIVVTYPAVDNPAEAGEYAVEVGLNDVQNATGTLTIESEETA